MLSFIGLGSFGSQHYTKVAITSAVDGVCWSGGRRKKGNERIEWNNVFNGNGDMKMFLERENMHMQNTLNENKNEASKHKAHDDHANSGCWTSWTCEERGMHLQKA